MLYNRKNLEKFLKFEDELPDKLRSNLKRQTCFCGSSSFQLVSDTTRHSTVVNISKCTQCGTIQIVDYPNGSDLIWYYSNVYRKLKHSSRSPEETFTYQLKHEDKLNKFLYPFKGEFDSVLDYGGASGGRFHFLKRLHEKSVSIYDLDENFIEYAESRGLNKCIALQKFDLICLYHVVEHMVEPVKELRGILESHLTSDGYVLIAVPPADTALIRNGVKGLLMDMHIAHRFYFTGKNLELLGKILGLTLISQSSDMFLFKQGSTPESFSSLKMESLSDSDKNLKRLHRYSKLIPFFSQVRDLLAKSIFSRVITRIGRLKAKIINER